MSDIWSLSFLYKFIKFGIVGFSGLFVDFGFTYICKEILKIQKYVSNAIGFTLAASSNYYLNRVWTFKSTDPEIFVEYSEFMSKVFAIAVVTVWNFLANAFITFS
jgi:putative flippase GtrA